MPREQVREEQGASPGPTAHYSDGTFMGGLVSQQTLELIRAASDIVEVIGSYLPLTKRAGANFIALCPFHK